MIASTILDQLIGALRHHERRPAGQYRLVRPTFRMLADADHWMREQGAFDDGRQRWTVLYEWLALRQRHHVAWLERGGSEQ